MNYLDDFVEIINKYSSRKVNINEVNHNIRLIEDLEMDSLLLISFFSELEEKFRISIDTLDFDNINNITMLYNYIIKVNEYEQLQKD